MLALILSPMSAEAKNNCPPTFLAISQHSQHLKSNTVISFSEAYELRLKKEIFDQNILKKEISKNKTLQKEIRDIFPRLDAILGKLQLEKINIAFNEQFSLLQSVFMPAFQEIQIGIRESLDSAKLLPTLLHEYGHAIFHKNIRILIQGRRISPLKEFFDRNDLNHAFFSIDMKLRFATNKLSSTEVRGLQEQKKVLEKELAECDARGSLPSPLELKEIDNMLWPYNEMFADLIVAFYYRDGKIMADSIGFAKQRPYFGPLEKDATGLPQHRQNNPNGSRPRDFTETSSFKGWKSEGKVNGQDSPHSVLDPSRGAMWKILLGKLRKDVKPEQVLNAYLEATSVHYSLRLSRGEKSTDAHDWEALNKEFFRTLIDEFKKLNLWRSSGN